MKKFLNKAIEKIHLRVFGHEMSDQMRAFLNNLSWSFYAGAISTPISIVIGTLAGRFMGPTEFGKYNLVILVSSYVVVFAFLGLDISTVKRIAKAKTDKEKETSFFSSFVFIVSMLAILSVLGIILSPLIVTRASCSSALIISVVIFTFATSIKSILDVLVRALEKFKLQATGRMFEILTLTAAFVLILVFFKKMNYQLYLAVIILGIIAISSYFIQNLKKYFHNFSWAVLKSQLSEGRFFMLAGILGTVFISSDRLLIAKYLDVTNLGIYSAYYTASLGLVTTLSLIVTNVLLPATAKSNDKTFTKKLDQLFAKGFVPVYLLTCAAIFVFLKIFGQSYPLKLNLVLLFAFVACLYLYQIIYNIIILDANRKEYIQYFCISTIVNFTTVGYYFILMKYLSKSIVLLLVGYSINLMINLIVQKIFIKGMREDSIKALSN